MIKKSELEAAIKDEREAIEMYTSWAEEAESTVLSNTYHKIAEDEMRHKKLLDEILESFDSECAVKKRKK